MLLTLSARRIATGPTRRLPARLPVAAAVAIVAGAAASFVLRPMLSPAPDRPANLPVWAGAIGDGVSGQIVMPPHETSASYTSPVAIQAASRARAKPCAETGCANPPREVRTLLPPRRPAPEPAVAALAPAPDIAAPAPVKAKSVFTPAGLIERLPTTDTLLKPFATVSDKMSGLIKRF